MEEGKSSLGGVERLDVQLLEGWYPDAEIDEISEALKTCMTGKG